MKTFVLKMKLFNLTEERVLRDSEGSGQNLAHFFLIALILNPKSKNINKSFLIYIYVPLSKLVISICLTRNDIYLLTGIDWIKICSSFWMGSSKLQIQKS